MHRQRSILSFFQKPSPDNHGSSGAGVKPCAVRFPQHSASAREIPSISGEPSPSGSNPKVSSEPFGTDTPPEKPPRRVFSTTDLTPPSDGKGSSLFSSIMHKFMRDDDTAKLIQRFKVDGDPSIVCSMSNKCIDSEETSKVDVAASKPQEKLIYSDIKSTRNQHFPFFNNGEGMLVPETPSERPLIPHLKRVQEDYNKLDDKSDNTMKVSHKRMKFLEEPKLVNKHSNKDLETASKFEWLDPSQIRDAKRRRPDDPLYDKRTLHIPTDVLKKMSASQKQYWSVKCQYMDVVLFFKVGKFYELYELDAEIGHKELDWKMTYSGVGKCRQVGISEHGIDDAVQKLVSRGYKVGRIEQLETSEQAKARGSNCVIQRKLINVITPSTTVDENISPDAVHLLAIKEGSTGLECGSTVIGFAFVDCAALKIWVGSVEDDSSYAALGALLMQVSPKEIIYEHRGLSKEAEKAIKKYSLTGSAATQITPVQPSKGFQDCKEVQNEIQLNQYFKGSGKLSDHLLDGVVHHEIALGALGGLIENLSRLMMDDVLRNGNVLPYQVYKGCVRMDGQTLVNLEIFSNNADGGPAGTLFKFLDNCITPSGKRLLRSWICHPLKDINGITCRLDVVEALTKKPEVMLIVAQHLRKIPDLERLFGRVKSTVQSSGTLLLPLVGNKTLKQRVKVFGSLVKGVRLALNLLTLIQKEVKEPFMSLLSKIVEIPVLDGHHGLHEFLNQFEAAIASDFPQFQDHIVKESDAETLSVLIELFVERAREWSQVLYAMNCIDVLRSFAIIANESSRPMCRPVVVPLSKVASEVKQNKGPNLVIKGLWHAFALGENGAPVPNDISLGGQIGQAPCTLLLTGPNMGGKSTLLRAACLAVIMAQLGCYVPCEECFLSLVDTIFTRLGATDRIMTGESTFYIECAETASVLRNATQDSLVLLDELGRGTSTFDGYAIAYAAFRHLVEKVKCRLLFATHYHPLTKEFASHPHVTLQHMACAFEPGGGNELVFLYRLAPGACPESYGLQVALMAGIPTPVVEAASRAARVMKQAIGNSFLLSEKRSNFSTLHEEWLNTLASVSGCADEAFNDDVYDTLFCLWHELKNSYASLHKSTLRS